jgi:phenylpropionate dioxygenase-like ring-hydroxylating dioxygenase large terminal subunit
MTSLPPLNRPLNERAESSFTLSSEYYLSQDVYELEKQQIFYKTWQYVAHESMLADPGDYITLTLCDENIFVIRSSDNKLRAFYNVCRHRAHELLKGSGNVRKMIVCPYHAWSYSNTGDLMRAPLSEHRIEFDKDAFCLREIRLESFCGFVFINLDNQCESLQSIAGDLEQDIRREVPYLDELQYVGADMFGETRIEAGWKVVIDNYVECYHCRPAHKDFASIIDMNSYQTDVYPYWSRQFGRDIRYENTAYEVDPDLGIQHSFFWYLWPNTTFNVLPGSNELGVFVVRPSGVNSCDFGGHSFSVDGKMYQPRAEYAANVLAPEDINLCESVQRGLRSLSYDQGAFMVNPASTGESEHALHHFHRLVHSSLSQE